MIVTQKNKTFWLAFLVDIFSHFNVKSDSFDA